MAKVRREIGEPLSAEKLKLLQDFIRINKVDKKDLVGLLGVGYTTVKQVFNGKPVSRLTNSKISLFIKNKNLAGKSGEDLKIEVENEITSPRPLAPETISRINQFIDTTGLNKTDVANILGLPRSSFHDALNRESISQKNKEKIEQFAKRIGKLAVKKAGIEGEGKAVSEAVETVEERAERIKHLLLALHSEFSFFKASKEARAVFKKLLNEGDVGFIGCFLTALTGDEAQFKRWIENTTYRFDFFRKKGK